MKTITEFSGILLQQAAGAQQAFLAAHPPVEEPAAEPPPAAEPTAEVAPAADTPEEAAAQPQSEEASAAQEVRRPSLRQAVNLRGSGVRTSRRNGSARSWYRT